MHEPAEPPPGPCKLTSGIIIALSVWVAVSASLCWLCAPVQGGLLKPDVDFSNYDVPLLDQVVNRIKAKVSARLGEGKNARDRYFIVPFAYQNKGNAPEFSHSFLSFIRVFADKKQQKFTPGLKRGKYQNRNFEAFTISWLPHDFDTNPHLCVFDGLGSRVDPKRNQCPISDGKNFTLPETLELAVNEKVAVGMWGPYEVRKVAFDLGVGRRNYWMEGRSVIEPMTAFIAKIGLPSIVSMRWPD